MTAQRPLARGILVALEGIDGTGKSTQARHLAAIFREQGYVVALLREPTVSPWGRRIREAMTAGHREGPDRIGIGARSERGVFRSDRNRLRSATSSLHIEHSRRCCRTSVPA